MPFLPHEKIIFLYSLFIGCHRKNKILESLFLSGSRVADFLCLTEKIALCVKEINGLEYFRISVKNDDEVSYWDFTNRENSMENYYFIMSIIKNGGKEKFLVLISQLINRTTSLHEEEMFTMMKEIEQIIFIKFVSSLGFEELTEKLIQMFIEQHNHYKEKDLLLYLESL
jgi:hypothetical protein